MGGKAFADIGEPIRLPTVRMEPLARSIANAIGAKIVLWPRLKADHGDIDLVIPSSIVDTLGDDELARRVGLAAGVDYVSKRPDKNDPILFVGLKIPEGLFQVDLISAPDDLLDFATRYLSWGDTGTMIGRIAREMGMTFGQNGLRLPIRIPGVGKDTLLLTPDFGEALTLLGWDPSQHDAGFDDDRDIADFIASGRYFDPKVYDPARASSEARRRGKVRRGRDELTADLMARSKNYDWPAEKGSSPAQAQFIRAALAKFDKFEATKTMTAAISAKAVRPETAFSVETVMSASGCSPEEVRAVVAIIMEDFPGNNTFPAWKESCTMEEVIARAKAAYPIYIERQAAEEVDRLRREAITREHERNRAKRERRLAAGGNYRR